MGRRFSFRTLPAADGDVVGHGAFATCAGNHRLIIVHRH